MAAPVWGAVKAATKKALSSKLRNSGLAKRVAKLEGIADAVSDIASAIKDRRINDGAPNLAADVSQNANVNWETVPDFNGWNVHQVDSYLFGSNPQNFGGDTE